MESIPETREISEHEVYRKIIEAAFDNIPKIGFWIFSAKRRKKNITNAILNALQRNY